MAWRYIASRLNGDGTETFLNFDVPLSGVTLTETLSGPDALAAKIEPEVLRMKGDDGLPLFVPWSTALYAEADGAIRLGSIVTGLSVDGPTLSVEAGGFVSYLTGLPYTGTRSRIDTDPLTEARHMWAHAQGHKGGNLGLTLDDTSSKVRIGTKKDEKQDPDSDVEPGPYVLAWYQTEDLGSEFEKLAEETPFEYREAHAWNGETISHRLRLGYPRLGRRRSGLRFVIGENVSAIPTVTYDAEEYASEVVTLGAGEGRKMVRGSATRKDSRLRRVAVVQDKTLRNAKAADKAARKEVRRRMGAHDVTEIAVRDHPHAPIGSWSVGDEIRLQGDTGWTGDLDLWVRVVALTISPDEGETAVLEVVRADKLED